MIAKPGFKRPAMPAAAAEQKGAQWFAAKMQKPPALACQAGKGDNCAREYPGFAVPAQAYFADPGKLTQGDLEAPGFFKRWRSKAFPLHFHMKRTCAPFLQSPGKGAFHL